MEGIRMGKLYRGLVLVTVALALVVGSPIGLRAATADPNREAGFLAKLNELRLQRGLRPLAVREDLAAVARSWSQQMLRANDISHNPNLSAQAPSDWTRLGENVGVGGSVQQIHDAFVASPTHLRQMVDGAFDSVGIGVSLAPDATIFVTVNFMTGAAIPSANLASPVPASPAPPSAPGSGGYRLASANGGIFGFGDAVFHGSAGALGLTRPIVGTDTTPSRNGYWLVASDGGIFGFGDARFFGSTGAIKLNQPIVGMASTPSGNGYWLVASDGGIFAYGDAKFFGSTGAIALNKPIVGMAATPSGKGYWLVATDGGMVAFGDAGFYGSTGAITLNKPIVGMTPTPSGKGYWLVASDGGIFAFGDAPFYGSTGNVKLNQPIVGMAATPTGKG
ncbi:MAG TPA: CAP domain-containing protein, partial [Acidimicrobiales bacterium]|nr:CAP domain-containing protein [Acidimicrobiales bacterium]